MRFGRILLGFLLVWMSVCGWAQINTDRVMLMGRNALYYDDYVLSIQRFNLVINAKPYLAEPYFFRGLAKFYLEDYTGAEMDCSEAITRNSYKAHHYQLRGLCRVNLKKFELASEDYERLLAIEPRNKTAWHNRVLCLLEMKKDSVADACLDTMIRLWPKDAENYTIKSQVALNRGDTVQGLSCIDKALEMDPYEGRAWSMRSSVSLQRGEYKQAESELDKAIQQMPRMAGLYINRALARYHQRNLRGAMADYDASIDIDPKNYLGHFNRGLLRAQTGDDNSAIEDFNYVLNIEPDNMIALFNRALLLDNVGDYDGAIRDISAVIAEYPEFWTGYQFRASILRKIGDAYGAERDEFKVMKAQMESRSKNRKKSAPTKTRKRSERNMDDYDKLVEADVTETEHQYASEYRGRVQDRKTELQPEPMYMLTYYRRENAVKRYIPYYNKVEELNRKNVLLQPLYLANEEATLDESKINLHFQTIAEFTEKIKAAPNSSVLFLARALDYYQVRDFESALVDLKQCLEIDSLNPLAYFIRVQVREMQLEALRRNGDEKALKPVDVNLGYRSLLSDLDEVIRLDSNFVYAFYNQGNIYIKLGEYDKAVQAYSKALALDPGFPSAYFNRGVAYLLSEKTQKGLADLSTAGELGLYTAYNLIKRYSKVK